MRSIRPVSDLRNSFAAISRDVHESGRPVFLTKNGYGSMVVMNMEQYESLVGGIESKLDAADRQASSSTLRYSHNEVFGAFLGIAGIVEEADASVEQKKIKEINSGAYWFNIERLLYALGELKPFNSQGEYYLTDTIALIKKIGLRVSAMPLTGEDVDDIMGVNTPEQLKKAEEIMQKRNGLV